MERFITRASRRHFSTDIASRPLHTVVQAAVHDVLLAGSGHSLVELHTWGHRNLAAHSPEPEISLLENNRDNKS